MGTEVGHHVIVVVVVKYDIVVAGREVGHCVILVDIEVGHCVIVVVVGTEVRPAQVGDPCTRGEEDRVAQDGDRTA